MSIDYVKALGDDFASRVIASTSEWELDGTIPEEIFITELKRVWVSPYGYNNTFTEKLGDCWRGILKCINNSLIGSGVNVSTATMGAGKSSGAFIAAAIHSVLYPNEGVLILNRRTDECDELQNKLNQILPGTAISVHCKRGKDHWKNKPERQKIVVATHIGYLSHNLNKQRQLNDYVTDENIKKKRRLTIIDESLGFIKRYNLSAKFMKRVFKSLAQYDDPLLMRRDFNDEDQKLLAIYDAVTRVDIEAGQTKRGLLLDVEKKYRKVTFNKLVQKIADSSEKDFPIDEKSKKHLFENPEDYNFDDFQQGLVDDLLSLQAMLTKDFYGQADGSDIHLASGEIMKKVASILVQKEDVESCVILDGTAHINRAYKELKDSFPDAVYIQPEVKGVRNYKNMNIFVRSESSGLGKSSSVSKVHTRNVQIAEWANQTFTADDDVIFCGTLEVTKALKKYFKKSKPKFNYKLIHWNCIDGSNDYQNCNKFVLLSLPYPPRLHHESMMIALDKMDRLEKEEQQAWSNYKQELDASHMANHICQAIPRGICRKMKSNGNCAPYDVYMMMGGLQQIATDINISDLDKDYFNDTTKHLVQMVTQTFPKAQWNVWESFEGWCDRKPGQDMKDHNNVAVDWLKANLRKGQSIERSEFISFLEVTDDEKQSLSEAFTKSGLKRRKELHQLLVSLNIELKSTPGRYGKTIIVKK